MFVLNTQENDTEQNIPWAKRPPCPHYVYSQSTMSPVDETEEHTGHLQVEDKDQVTEDEEEKETEDEDEADVEDSEQERANYREAIETANVHITTLLEMIHCAVAHQTSECLDPLVGKSPTYLLLMHNAPDISLKCAGDAMLMREFKSKIDILRTLRNDLTKAPADLTIKHLLIRLKVAICDIRRVMSEYGKRFPNRDTFFCTIDKPLPLDDVTTLMAVWRSAVTHKLRAQLSNSDPATAYHMFDDPLGHLHTLHLALHERMYTYDTRCPAHTTYMAMMKHAPHTIHLCLDPCLFDFGDALPNEPVFSPKNIDNCLQRVRSSLGFMVGPYMANAIVTTLDKLNTLVNVCQ